MPSNALKYKIEVLDKASKELKQVAREMGILDSKTKKTKPSLEQMGSQLMKFAKGGIVGAAVIGGFMAMKRVAKELINAYRIQEQAEAKLSGALLATGINVQKALPGLKEFAAKLQNVTLYGDEASIAAESLLVSVGGLDENGVKKILPGVQDFATALGIDLNTAASLVAKTINSSTNALTRYGVQVDMSGSKSDKLASLTDALKEKFGGMSKAAANTSTGALTQLSNAYGDLKEQMGRSIADGFKPVTSWLTKIIEKMTEAKKATNDYKDALDKMKSGKGTAQDALTVAKQDLVNLKSQSAMTTGNASVDKQYQDLIKQQISEKEAEIRAMQTAMTAEMLQQKAKTAAEKKAAEKAAKIAEINKKYADQWKTILKIQDGLKGPLEKQAEEIQKQIRSIHLAWGKGSKYEKERVELLKTLNEKYQKITDQIILQKFKGTGFVTDESARKAGNEHFALATAGTPHGGSAVETPTALQNILASLKPLGDMFMGMLPSLTSITKLLNPIQTILSAMFQTLEPVINTLLRPLLGIFQIIGVTLGRMLVPVLKILSPIVEIIGKAFVWLYNNAIVPLGNFIIGMIRSVNNAIAGIINGIVGAADWLIKLFGGKGISWRMPTMAEGQGNLTKISMNDLNAYGSDAEGSSTGGSTTGAGANYTAGKSTVVNVVVNTEVIAGDNGIRDLALMIRNEITAAQALGY